jgi:nucleoid DNA-binding protein
MFASIVKGAHAATKNQPSLAPVALGGPIIAGVVMMLIGGYKIADCLRYQTASGQCDEVVESNMTAIVSGPLILLTGWGGFNTYNKKLREGETEIAITPRELVVDAPSKEEIRSFYETGATQVATAKHFGITRHQVQKALKNFDRGR